MTTRPSGSHLGVGALPAASGPLDEHDHAAAADPAASRRPVLGQPPEPHGEVQAALVVTGVVAQAERSLVRKAADQVAPAQRHPVDPQRPGGVVNQSLEHVRRIGTAGAAVGSGRDLVRAHPDERHLGRRDVIAAGDQHRRGMRRNRGRRQQVGAEVRQQPRADREHPSATVERQLQLTLDAAALVGGQEVLDAVLGPFHRPPQVGRRDRRRDDLGRDRALAAEGAADIGHDHPNRLLREAEDVGELGQGAVGILCRAPHGQPARAGVGLDHAPARLDRHRGHPGQRVAPAHHVRGGGESRIHLPGGARPSQERVIGGPRRDHGGTRLVVDLDQLGRVLGERARPRDHRGDWLADVAHLVGRQDRMRLVGDLGAVQRRDRKRPDAVAQLGGGQHRDQPRRRLGRGDRPDRGVGVRASHERGV